MATFYPSLETIAKFKVPPTEGEQTLLDFLGRVLDDSYEVYFNPYLNGDRPDVLIMREGNGVLVIEVKDWNLDNFTLNEKKRWVYTPNNSFVKSPIDQVLKYKSNLFDLHIDQLLELIIKNIKHFNIVACAVYFHCASQQNVEDLLIKPYKNDKKYMTFLDYNIDFMGRDGLEAHRFNMILNKRYLSKEQHSYLFTKDIYLNFKRILSPSIHLKTQGDSYKYSDKQKEIIYGRWENGELKVQLEQRVKGVYGSGKTTVLAARAVQAYKRALKKNMSPRILILTFNITLKNYIHDKLNQVEETFPIENFIIINYHQFINAELNNLNIEFNVPEELPTESLEAYLESYYYGNIALFEQHQERIKKYDAVLIDEIQDFHRPWMEIIKRFYRDTEGDYVLFGDVKQNIYGQPIAQKDVVTNVQGKPNELKDCYRSDFKVKDLAISFQRNVFGDKYDIDDFSENGTWSFMGHDQQKEGYINYMYLSETNTIVALYNIIRGNILNKANEISPNDITILGYTTTMLRFFDCYYRYLSRERTNTMMETIESMYLIHLKNLSKEVNNKEGYLAEISSHITQKLFPNKKHYSDKEINKLRQRIAELFTIHDLYALYPETFEKRMKEICDKCGIKFETLEKIWCKYNEELDSFKHIVYKDDYKIIRDNKKLHFWLNSGTIKISTINSFKGWESEVVFLIIEARPEYVSYFAQSFNELLYTGLTRCKRNLVIVNFGNAEYDKKIRPLIEQLK